MIQASRGERGEKRMREIAKTQQYKIRNQQNMKKRMKNNEKMKKKMLLLLMMMVMMIGKTGQDEVAIKEKWQANNKREEQRYK